MEKYQYLKELTKEYLDGDLSTLRMDYNDTQYTIVTLIYEDKNKYRFNYSIEIDKDTKEAKFLTHICEYCSDRIALRRNPTFEKAVNEYLFDSV